MPLSQLLAVCIKEETGGCFLFQHYITEAQLSQYRDWATALLVVQEGRSLIE